RQNLVELSSLLIAYYKDLKVWNSYRRHNDNHRNSHQKLNQRKASTTHGHQQSPRSEESPSPDPFSPLLFTQSTSHLSRTRVPPDAFKVYDAPLATKAIVG